MPYAHKNNPPKTSAPADCNKICCAYSAAAVRPLERHFLVLLHHIERPVLDMDNLRGVAVIVYVIDIGILGRVSGDGLVAVYLPLDKVYAVAYHGGGAAHVLKGRLDKFGGFLETVEP